MKIRYLIILVLAFLTLGNINVQELKETWISTYNRELKTVNEREILQDNKTFRLEKSGTIVKGTDRIDKQSTLTGNWEISRTGEYIILEPENSSFQYLTIKLQSNYLEIFYEFEALYDNSIINNRTIKMKKQHKTESF